MNRQKYELYFKENCINNNFELYIIFDINNWHSKQFKKKQG